MDSGISKVNQLPIVKTSNQHKYGCPEEGHGCLSILGQWQLEDIKIYFPNLQLFHFFKDEYLFRENEYAEGIYFLEAGKVKLVKAGEFEEEYIIRLARSGDLLGLCFFLCDQFNNSAIALETVITYFIPRDDFLAFFKKKPECSLEMMKMICEKIGEAEKRIAGLSQKNPRQRVAEMLLDLRSIYEADEIPLSKDDLANISCTSWNTLTSLMRDFRRKQLIEISRQKIRLLNLEKLTRIAELELARV